MRKTTAGDIPGRLEAELCFAIQNNRLPQGTVALENVKQSQPADLLREFVRTRILRAVFKEKGFYFDAPDADADRMPPLSPSEPDSLALQIRSGEFVVTRTRPVSEANGGIFSLNALYDNDGRLRLARLRPDKGNSWVSADELEKGFRTREPIQITGQDAQLLLTPSALQTASTLSLTSGPVAGYTVSFLSGLSDSRQTVRVVHNLPLKFETPERVMAWLAQELRDIENS